jgi:CrcB protein
MNAIWVFIGGGLGSLARYGISLGALRMGFWKSSFPWATLIANLAACAIMAALLLWTETQEANNKWRLMGMIGFCGGLSTFSTFSLENYRLLENGFYSYLAANILLNTLGCLAIFWIYHRVMAQ